MSPREPRLSWHAFGLFCLASLALAACQDMANGGATGVNEARTLDRDAIRSRLSAIAIRVGEDLYMIPSGLDDDGCEMFKPYSSRNPVKTAIHYRQADGGFGVAKEPAMCKVEMIAVDTDRSGCVRYRAQPVNGVVAVDEQVIYEKKTDGSYAVAKSDGACG